MDLVQQMEINLRLENHEVPELRQAVVGIGERKTIQLYSTFACSGQA